MKDRPQSDIEWFQIADRAEEYSFAELKFIVDEAARVALSDRRPITTNDLATVLDQNPPHPKMAAEGFH